jgi:plasmid stabilization system protein ParE
VLHDESAEKDEHSREDDTRRDAFVLVLEYLRRVADRGRATWTAEARRAASVARALLRLVRDVIRRLSRCPSCGKNWLAEAEAADARSEKWSPSDVLVASAVALAPLAAAALRCALASNARRA